MASRRVTTMLLLLIFSLLSMSPFPGNPDEDEGNFSSDLIVVTRLL